MASSKAGDLGSVDRHRPVLASMIDPQDAADDTFKLKLAHD
jgi:hypothetical protein